MFNLSGCVRVQVYYHRFSSFEQLDSVRNSVQDEQKSRFSQHISQTLQIQLIVISDIALSKGTADTHLQTGCLSASDGSATVTQATQHPIKPQPPCCIQHHNTRCDHNEFCGNPLSLGNRPSTRMLPSAYCTSPRWEQLILTRTDWTKIQPEVSKKYRVHKLS
ncbi:hypothetical protein J6590_007654 [Homalodisca vitripennis]|nr:hypothetical protein J6590_007654 [Homalodisca vitripennis]